MFELYKKRDLGTNFSDTITFFKSFGKHFFKNFFIINGIFLMILVVLIYFISKIYIEVLFGSVNNTNNPSYLLNYFSNNALLISGSFIVVFLLIVILSMLNISFPVIYLKLFAKTNNDDFSTQEIINGLKEIIGRMIVFLLGTVFIILPLAFVVFVLLVLLCFILIGIPLFVIFGSAFFAWITLSYYEFILKKVGFFTALSNGYKIVKQQFWIIVGTTFLMIMLIQIIQGFITMIPYLISMVWMLISTQNLQKVNSLPENFSTMGIVMAVIMVFSVLLSYIFNNFIIISQGLIYYSSQEEKENFSTKNQIDLIGTEIE